jgi:hypothetical protein
MRMLPRLAVAAILAITALLAVSGSLSGPARWSPDGLFYQAKVYEIHDGLTQGDALRRAFRGPLGTDLRAIDPERSGSRQWVAYNARFYERRLTVPVAASVLTPLAGDRALLDVSIAGYVAVVLAIFALLLVLRLPLGVATGVSLATAFLPALTKHSTFPLTDSWGLALETAAFAVGILALRHGRRWLIPWFAIIALLSLTRDSMWIPILAAAAVAVVQRSRIATALAASGVVAALPAFLAVQVPLRELLGEMLNGGQPVPDASWGSILGKYPAAVVDLLQANGGYVRDGAWLSAAYLLVGLGALVVLAARRPREDSSLLLLAGAIAGAAYVIVVPVFSAFRLELVLVPMAAAGLGFAALRAVEWARTSVWGVAGEAPPRPGEVGARGPNRKAGPSPQAALSDVGSNR